MHIGMVFDMLSLLCSLMFSLDPDTQVMSVLTSRLFLVLQAPAAVWS